VLANGEEGTLFPKIGDGRLFAVATRRTLIAVVGTIPEDQVLHSPSGSGRCSVAHPSRRRIGPFTFGSAITLKSSGILDTKWATASGRCQRGSSCSRFAKGS
jgi:hypothetical protein